MPTSSRRTPRSCSPSSRSSAPSTLLKNGWTTQRAVRPAPAAGRTARGQANSPPQARVRMAETLLNAADHDVELYKVNIADNTLVAPRDGRIEYRIANVGEVLPAGGKVFTMLDIGYVYMDIYLPTATAGRVKIGDDARIVLDAYPDRPIPAKVTFIAAQAQFTPKMVETQTERDKLMFRIRVRIDPERRAPTPTPCGRGLPGVAYVKFDAKAEWPERLQGKPWQVAAAAARSPASTASATATTACVALDGVTLDIPAGPHHRVDRPRRRRQVDAAGPGRRRQAHAGRQGRGAGRRHGRRPASRRDLPAHRLHAAGPGQEPLSRPQRAREHRLLRPPVRPGPRRAQRRGSPTCWTAPGLRRSPTGWPASSPAACARSSACAAR